MNVGNPETAFAFGQLPNEGIGLARLEFARTPGVRPTSSCLDKGDLGCPERSIPECSPTCHMFCSPMFPPSYALLSRWLKGLARNSRVRLCSDQSEMGMWHSLPVLDLNERT